MADIVTGTVTGLVDMTATNMAIADVRREEAVGVGVITDVVKTESNRVTGQDTAYFIAGQQINFQNATALAALTAGTNAQFAATQSAIQLAAQSNATATALAAAQTQALVSADGATTRALINSQKIDDLRAALDRAHDHRGHGCGEKKEGVLNFGPPLSAQYPV
jgi:hypothetical protein